MTYASGIKNRIGNYHYADGALRRLQIGGNSYVIGIAGAYNAYGLIGPEHNGIFILDEDNKCVVLDRHCEIGSGYYGPSREQQVELNRICDLETPSFRNFIRNHARSRIAA